MRFEDLNLSNRAIEIIKETRFAKWQIPIAIRAGFKCEYCGLDLLDSVNSYDSWQIDHIVPVDNNDFENLALTCKTCNFIKRHSAKDELDSLLSRSEKIEHAKKLISERRFRKEATLKLILELASLIKDIEIEK